MSMFNWQSTVQDTSTSNSEGVVVSSYFWIYWVVTVPLTILVGISWRFWWKWERSKLDEDILSEVRQIEEPGNFGPKKDKGRYRV
jgi:hypothetical protein